MGYIGNERNRFSKDKLCFDSKGPGSHSVRTRLRLRFVKDIEGNEDKKSTHPRQTLTGLEDTIIPLRSDTDREFRSRYRVNRGNGTTES